MRRAPAALLCAALPPARGGAARSVSVSEISQFNITFRFAAPVQAGQYATGDWWVVAPAEIVAVDPPAAPGRDGWQLNPSDATAQALDDRVARYNASLAPALPLPVGAGDAVVKAVSVRGGGASCRPCVQVAAVLSAVAAPPPAGAFRPPYFGTPASRRALPAYTAAQLRVAAMPSLDAVDGAPTDEWMRRRFEKPQIDWLLNWEGRLMHPADAMPDYGAAIASDTGDGALKLLATPAADTRAELAVGYVQFGIDSFAILRGGGGWPANGGHDNGRKLPIVVAALLLGDDAMAAATRSAAAACVGDACAFSEDGELARAPAHANITLFGGDSGGDVEERYWKLVTDPKCDGNRISRDPYGWIDGGFQPGDSYQVCCTSQTWKATALPLMVWPAAADAFGDAAFTAYVRRWVSFGAWAQPDPCAPPAGRCSAGGAPCTGVCGNTSPCGSNGTCVLSMDGYGKTFGPDGNGGCIPDADPSDGVGRFPTRHGANRDHGSYASKFASAMWARYAPSV